jgi:uncharacterized protein
MKNIVALLAILAVMVIIVGPVSAIDYPNLGGEIVSDFAHVLTPAQINDLTTRIMSLEENTTIQVAAVTVRNTNGEDPTLYAAHIGTRNGVGQRATDNGIVLLLIVDDNHWAIATGSGIEGDVTDLDVGRINGEIRPYLGDGQYYQCFSIAVDRISGLMDNKNTPAAKPTGNTLVIIVAVIVVIILIGLKAAAGDDDDDGGFVGGFNGGGSGGFGGGGFSGGGGSI